MRLHNILISDYDLGQPDWVNGFVAWGLPGQLRTYLLSAEGQLILARVTQEREEAEVPQDTIFTGNIDLYASNVTGFDHGRGYHIREDVAETRPVTYEYLLSFNQGKLVEIKGGLNVLDWEDFLPYKSFSKTI